MRLRYTAVLLALAALVVTSPAQADTGFSATINAAQEVPTNASTGTGSATLVLNTAQTQLSYSVTFSGLTSNKSAMHIHGPAAPGVNAGVLHGLLNQSPAGTSGFASGVWNIPAANLTHLFNGLLYINIHSVNFSPGEIRGQIIGNPTSTRGTTWGRLKQLYK